MLTQAFGSAASGTEHATIACEDCLQPTLLHLHKSHRQLQSESSCHRALGNSHVWPLREDSACIVDPPTDAIIHGLVGQSAHLLVYAELASQSESTRIRVEHCLLQASMQHMPKFQARATLALQKCSVRLFASGLFKVQ